MNGSDKQRNRRISHRWAPKTALLLLMFLGSSLIIGQGFAGSPLVYVSNRDGDRDLYLWDGQSTQKLTDNSVFDSDPRWSRDGRYLAYVTQRGGTGDIRVYDTETERFESIASHPATDIQPAWSPDGRRLAFTSTRGGRSDIYVVPLDDRHEAINLSQSATGAARPVWSSDGHHLVFEEFVGRGTRLMRVRPDGSDRQPLPGVTDDNAWGVHWAPSSNRLVFVARRDGLIDIHLKEGPADSPRALTNTPWLDLAPAWSPSGDALVFLSSRRDKTRREVFTMQLDGERQRNLTQSGAEEADPTWSPDGASIAFARYQPEGWVICRIPSQGGDVQILSEPARYAGQPQYRPRTLRLGQHGATTDARLSF